MNVAAASDTYELTSYDPRRYESLSLGQLLDAMRGTTLTQLKRGTTAVLIARREWGGMLVAISKLVTSHFEQIELFRHVVDLDYADARRHMKLWIHWDRIAKMLSEREESYRKRGIPFIIPGYRRCLMLAGLVTKRDAPEYEKPPALPERPELPQAAEELVKVVTDLEQQNRLERAENARLRVELDLAHDEIRDLAFNARRGNIPAEGLGADLIIKGFDKIAGWLRRKPVLPAVLDRPASIEVRIGDCLDLMEQTSNVYDAIVTDAPYAISLHGYQWDSTDIPFSPALWSRMLTVLKPGGYAAFFAAPRLYHRVATAAEQAGFIVHPFLSWRFREGLPKPINVSELFDRDNLDEREVIGQRRGSGFTQANVDHGAQSRTHLVFTAHARHVSDESQAWRGYFYGTNALKPCIEPILLVQKPIAASRMIDNIRQWGTGALNIGVLKDHYGQWPSTMFTHRKATKDDHKTDHPSVKPLSLMEDLCSLVCPGGGRILDMFAGTGTTGIAARNRGFDCVLIEQNEDMRYHIENRLRR